MNTNDYEARGAATGRALLNNMTARHLGPDSAEQAEQLAQWFADPLTDLADRVEWVVNGSYGSEYYNLIRVDLAALPTTKGRRAQAIKRIAIIAFQVFALCDYGDLNQHKIIDVVKASGRIDAINAALIAMIEQHLADEADEAA